MIIGDRFWIVNNDYFEWLQVMDLYVISWIFFNDFTVINYDFLPCIHGFRQRGDVFRDYCLEEITNHYRMG